MTLVAGYAPDERGHAALHLAAMLARSSGDHLVVCTVVPRPWFPSMAKVDAEYHAFVQQQADNALTQAQRQVPDDVTASFERRPARSAPAGILEVAEQHGAWMVVVGSSSAGMFGHVALGSVSDRLLHSSPIPVALAPRGFRSGPGHTVRRVTAAYGGSESATPFAVATAELAARVTSPLRLATFAVWSRPSYTMRLGTEGEDPVLHDWLATVRAAADDAQAVVKALPDPPRDLHFVVGTGEDWPAALEDVEWIDDEVLVVGSSDVGPVAAVFLGSRATKIVRHSPVPVVVVPRTATDRRVNGDEQTDERA